ncbi:Thiol-disulfide oxidoreductase ResA [Botrimarina colliarenosi]|uniref:Thiol-disulfide oxidoreductase ResA n=1 Tax=Botrimarina colliarenosi TaxID=2528001 RepID=A0A5C6AIV6_9BACT|nr:TlpA disulfide reductase family protein [Botrimarina colliarenosi]TWT99954.1 Thiol-disulfide oxidoreductase ResA [Botrimarina colliarenosi]
MTRPKASGGRFEGPVGLMVAVIAIVVAAALVERLTRPRGGERITPLPMPELLVEGWLNTGDGPSPTRESLRGSYVVLDLWATDCVPCLRSLPHLAQLSREWGPRGVEVVGLASEPASRREAVQAAIDRVPGMDWPVAYGAGMVFGQLGVEMIPTYVLFDTEGVGVWRGHSLGDLEAELASRL